MAVPPPPAPVVEPVDVTAPPKAARANPDVHFYGVDCATSTPLEFARKMRFAQIFRQAVFTDELGFDFAAMRVTEADQSYRHMFVQRGDIPLGYARWRVHSHPDTAFPVAGVIDMLCVHTASRKQGLGKNLAASCVVDIVSRLPKAGASFQGVYVVLPTPASYALFERLGFRPVEPGAPLPPGVSHPPPAPRDLTNSLYVCDAGTCGRLAAAFVAHQAQVREAAAARAGAPGADLAAAHDAAAAADGP